MKRREHRLIEAALREGWGTAIDVEVLEAASKELWRLLRTGAGEEILLERLAAIEPEAHDGSERTLLARDLLKIGVKPRGTGGGYRRGRQEDVCTLCDQRVSFCWGCGCGFRICQDCTEENRWGITCNNITWECPDCGGMRSF